MEKLISLISLICCLPFLTVVAHWDHNQQHRQQFLTKNKMTRQHSLLGGIYQRSFLEANTAPLRAWPELVGASVADAQIKIRHDMPMIRLQVITPDTIITMGYDRNRVRIYVDSSGIVTKSPRIG